MGWMVTNYMDSGVATADSVQLLTSLLWVVILAGRFAYSTLSSQIAPPIMILALSGGIIVFLIVLLMDADLMLMAAVGLGLLLSDMYGTPVADVGSIFREYPLVMSVFVTVTSLDSVITPSLVGSIATYADIRMGMAVLLIPAMAVFALALWNWWVFSYRRNITLSECHERSTTSV